MPSSTTTNGAAPAVLSSLGRTESPASSSKAGTATGVSFFYKLIPFFFF